MSSINTKATGVKTFKWDSDLRALVIEKLEDMNDILEGKAEAHRNHKRVGKCNNCSRRKGCPERLDK